MKFREVSTSFDLDSCHKSCGPHGVCIKQECFCSNGYSGFDCSVAKNDAIPHASSLTANLEAPTNSAVHTSFLLIISVSFTAGIVAFLIGQNLFEYFSYRQRKQAKDILKPLLRMH